MRRALIAIYLLGVAAAVPGYCWGVRNWTRPFRIFLTLQLTVLLGLPAIA